MNGRIDRDRLSVITGAIVLAMSLARLLQVSTRPLQVNVLGSPLGINLSETTVMLLIVMGMAITGVESLLQEHPLVQQGKLKRTLMFWIVPALLAVALSAWLVRIGDLGLWTLAVIGAALLIPLALVAEYVAVSPEQRRDTWLQWSYALLIHLVALILYAVVYDARWRGLLSGPVVFVATTLLATRLFWISRDDVRQVLLYGAVCGLILAEAIWILNYWSLSALQGGLVLLIVFYAVTGILQQWLVGRFNRRVAVEYIGVSAVALAAIFLSVP